MGGSASKGLSPVEAASIWMMLLLRYGALIEDARSPLKTRGHSRRIEQRGLAAIQIAKCRRREVDRLTRTSGSDSSSGRRAQVLSIATEEEGWLKEIEQNHWRQGAPRRVAPVGGPRSRSLSKQCVPGAPLSVWRAERSSHDSSRARPHWKDHHDQGHNSGSRAAIPHAKRRRGFCIHGLDTGTLKPVTTGSLPSMRSETRTVISKRAGRSARSLSRCDSAKRAQG